jgi:riboflavin kinase/FMN adenylyltransferase
MFAWLPDRMARGVPAAWLAGRSGVLSRLMSGRTAITIGNFDGVHRGHAALVQAARRAVGASGRVVVLAFDPHPSTILRTTHQVARLSSYAQRKPWLSDAGADEVIRLEPSVELLGKSPEEFIAWLAAQHRPDVLVEGSDFRFGRSRSGSIGTLRDLADRHRFELLIIDDVDVVLTDRSIVRASSTLARWLIGHGRVSDAAELFGRPYEMIGTVVRGDQRGRALGFPTANLERTDQLLPADGIYAGEAQLPDGRRVRTPISVGTKPTFGEHRRACESHLIGVDLPLDHYGWTIAIRFERWIREQMVFSSPAALADQIARDVQRAGESPRKVSTHPVMRQMTSAVAMPLARDVGVRS